MKCRVSLCPMHCSCNSARRLGALHGWESRALPGNSGEEPAAGSLPAYHTHPPSCVACHCMQAAILTLKDPPYLALDRPAHTAPT